MKKCVHCKELIDDKATKCKFCGSDLRNWFLRHKFLTTLLALFVLMIIFISSITKPEENTAAIQQNVSAYEVVTEGATGDIKNMDVYTAEKDANELIKINDKLVSENNQYPRLFIRYFNDKAVAKDYFKKQADQSISEKEKDRLFTHYIADYKSTVNQLNFNKNNNWETIKRY